LYFKRFRIPTNSTQATIASIKNTIAYFVAGVTGDDKIINNALTPTPIDTIRPAVISALKASTLASHITPDLDRRITFSCHVAADFVPSHPLTYQVTVAQLTLLFAYVEDLLEHKPHILQTLQLNIATGQPCGDPILDWFARELTPQLWKHFDPLVANMIVIASYDLINGIGIETRMNLKDAGINNLKNTPHFPDWLRFKTGLSEMYALLVLGQSTDGTTIDLAKYAHAIPDFIIFTNIVNDVISCYKEVLAGEKGNYIDMRAERDGVDFLTALRVVADEGICARNRVLAALGDATVSRANFDMYARGISHFHTSEARYRIPELFGAGLDKGLPG